jgi:hypothetical protein
LDSNPPLSNACPDANAALSQACAALSSGQSATFAKGVQSAYQQEDVEWQSAFYHDDQSNGFIHLLGKPANNDGAWKHQYFNTSTGLWTVVSTAFANGPGHIYGNTALDVGTGNLYQSCGDISSSLKVHRWRKSGGWDNVPVTHTISGAALNDHSNGLAYNPNLYGPGAGGLVIEQQGATFFWHEATDTVELTGHDTGQYGDREGIGVYWPAKNCCILGGSDIMGFVGHQVMVTPNATAGAKPVATDVGVPPIPTGGHSASGGLQFGSLHVHPGNPNKLLLLETNGQRAWTATLSGSTLTWTQIGNHPFTDIPHVICSLRAGLNCIWAVGTSTSVLWKPAA